jgi:adenylate kinase family enzyme
VGPAAVWRVNGLRRGLVSVVCVPLLGPGDPLPHRPRRVLVAGTSGSGKTTLAARIAVALQLPYMEIDALFHGPAWTPRPSFEADVRRFSAEPSWVTEWQYSSVRAHLAERADLLVWLDLPRALVLRQVIRRTLVRRLRRQNLWNGNIEPPLWTIFKDRGHIVRWAWRTHHRTAARVTELRRRRPDLVVVQLRSRREIVRWSCGPLRQSGAGPAKS